MSSIVKSFSMMHSVSLSPRAILHPLLGRNPATAISRCSLREWGMFEYLLAAVS